MEPLLIARITHNNGSETDWTSIWTVTLARSEIATPFLTFRTGNADEAQDAPFSLGAYFGYTADEIDVRHLY